MIEYMIEYSIHELIKLLMTYVERSRDSDVPMVHRWPGKLESLGGEVGAAMCFYVLIALHSRFNF